MASFGQGVHRLKDPELLISVGGLVGHLVLRGAPGPFVQQLRERYDAFVLPPSPMVARGFSLVIDFKSAGLSPERAKQSSARPLSVKSSARRVEIDRWDFEASLSRTGQPLGKASCELNPFSFDSLLRVLWSFFLPHAGGALFHACGLREGERAVLAPGPSEAGKTTLARKMPDPDNVLSDEVVAVHRDRDGQWRISGTPFWGEFARGGVSLRSWPLAGVAFLEKTPAPRAAPLSPAEAMLRALGCLICFQDDTEMVEKNVAFVAALCAEVPMVVCGSNAETPAAVFLETVSPFFDEAPSERAQRTPREMISELRAHLKRHRSYAFRPKGGSMRPWLRAGDSLFVEAASEDDLTPGDVVIYWRPGGSPEEDTLICHRMVARVSSARGTRIYTKGDALPSIEQFENGAEAQILGKVWALSRDGRTWPVPRRARSLAILFGSLLSMPIMKMLGRS